MATAAVLNFPIERSRDISDLHSQLLEVGIEGLNKVVVSLMNDFKGKDFQEISELLRDQGQQVTGALFSKLLGHIAANSENVAHCPQCQKPCKLHSSASRTVDSLHGEVKFERPYFYCESCEIGFAPFDNAMKLAPQKKQYDLQASAAELLTEVPYDTADRIFKRITGKSISDHTIHGIGSRLGETMRIEDVLPSRKMVETTIEEFSAGRGWRPVLVVSADGAHEPTRPETGKRAGKRGPGSFQEAKGFRIYLVGDDRNKSLEISEVLCV